ncbi:hypothetical protein BL03691 [Bacillus licheniformis DSM 13 = ATCC 14580]|uniref:Uncharacterized protein n=1 Tax=Bacillus licheniformis (strain ATCC 14580 / DSM 13 / JCM 2505 / CCUG 7422 / NBRC 12200 / NCIMB 9375 / NCTC 10341 / NRRL NRS-1264 / Gibson 46) TaxID=279010 RepID=Q65H89_BACLD|nr:hypothetical protein BL03691 [Bacillus licheniformis DSM 13 = ATCC 14580]AAU41575.1 hypothetical protein BLi02703 [Bacillus licheniformis DSM 13 = ATCC 14580]KUL17145.1 hypothetical protein LI6934_12270 [Bacillus licheniformis LMG 6934]
MIAKHRGYDSYMEDPFLDHEVKNADLKGAEIVSGLKLEIDKITVSISAIVHWTIVRWTIILIKYLKSKQLGKTPSTKSRTHFDVNSTVILESQKATIFLREVQWVPLKKSTPKTLRTCSTNSC